MNHLDLGFRLWCIGVQRWTLYTCTLEMMLSAKLAFKLDTASGCQGPHPDSGLKREQDPKAAKATQFFTSKVKYSTYQYLCTYTYTTESDWVWLRHKKCPENCGLRHCSGVKRCLHTQVLSHQNPTVPGYCLHCRENCIRWFIRAKRRHGHPSYERNAKRKGFLSLSHSQHPRKQETCVYHGVSSTFVNTRS